MNTVFHVGDTVKVKKVIYGAPMETLGMKGTIRSIYEDGPSDIGMVVEFPCEVAEYNWWNYRSEELELVQEVSHENT